MPPATTTSVSSAAMPRAASITAFRPEPQTLLIVRAATLEGSPARIAAWRAGAWPSPAETTLPMITSSTSSGATPARATASLTTIAPSSGAVNPLSVPRNLPVGGKTRRELPPAIGHPCRGRLRLLEGRGEIGCHVLRWVGLDLSALVVHRHTDDLRELGRRLLLWA